MRRLIFFITVLIITACDVTSPEEANEALLQTALDDLELAFNMHHLSEIMDLYSYDYLHNGDEWSNVELDWNIRLNDYQEMDLDDIRLDINGEEAVVSCVRRFYNDQIMIAVFNEPDDDGDISYWELKNNEWKISGNRAQFK